MVVVGLAATIASAMAPFQRSPGETSEPVAGLFAGSRFPLAQIETGTTPDHSACVALTGLENAACRVRANFEAHPNPGLANAIERLEGNASSHRGALPSRVALDAQGLEVAADHGAPIASR